MSRQPNFNVFIAFVSATDALRREPEVENLFDYGSTHTQNTKRKYMYKCHACLGLHKGFALVLVWGWGFMMRIRKGMGMGRAFCERTS